MTRSIQSGGTVLSVMITFDFACQNAMPFLVLSQNESKKQRFVSASMLSCSKKFQGLVKMKQYYSSSSILHGPIG